MTIIGEIEGKTTRLKATNIFENVKIDAQDLDMRVGGQRLGVLNEVAEEAGLDAPPVTTASASA
jgi:hypothetical protein